MSPRRPHAPGPTRLASDASAAPGDLHQAFDALAVDLDSIADRLRPAWETSDAGASQGKRLSSAGDDPEIVVHYPPDWQPPPSERRRLRESWESPREALAALPLEQEPSTDSLDADRTPLEQVPEFVPANEPVSDAPSPVRPAPLREMQAAAPQPDGASPAASAQLALQPISDSTAPAALSQPPGRGELASSRSGILAAAGLAALTLIGVGWRMLQPAAPTEHDGAAQSMAPETAPARVEQSATAESRAPAPPTPDSSSEPLAAEAAPGSGISEAHGADRSASAPPTAKTETETDAEPEPAALETPRALPPSSTRERETSAISEPATPRTPSDEQKDRSVGAPDAEQVAGALARAASRATSCAQPGGPSGAGSVRVLLDPAGGVLNATVTSSPFAGTEVGACIERAFGQASTAAYRGRSLTTVYHFRVDAP